MKKAKISDDLVNTWNNFEQQFQLTKNQVEKFKQYSLLLREWNKRINLTAIIDPIAIITEHFEDSLMITSFVDFSAFSMIADVGTGAGFPGVPLAIIYPDLAVMLIEVIQKKIMFLEELVTALNLKNVTINTLDWRSFLRNTSYPIELFLARASLDVDELVRIFKSRSPYRYAQLIYWASQKWKASVNVQQFIQREEVYTINRKKRRYVFFEGNL